MKQILNFGNLHTLLFIGKYDACFVNIFQDTFKEIKVLHVLSLVTEPSKIIIHRFFKPHPPSLSKNPITIWFSHIFA
uniref:Uncharacterized protein n=1 Tax=Arundo donax TaxID=35708 RepID=A0A0A8Z2L5_ARUDO